MSVMNDRFELLRLGRRLWFYEKCHEGADGRQDDLDDAVNARRHNGLSLCDGLPFLIPGKGEIFGCGGTSLLKHVGAEYNNNKNIQNNHDMNIVDLKSV